MDFDQIYYNSYHPHTKNLDSQNIYMYMCYSIYEVILIIFLIAFCVAGNIFFVYAHVCHNKNKNIFIHSWFRFEHYMYSIIYIYIKHRHGQKTSNFIIFNLNQQLNCSTHLIMNSNNKLQMFHCQFFFQLYV